MTWTAFAILAMFILKYTAQTIFCENLAKAWLCNFLDRSFLSFQAISWWEDIRFFSSSSKNETVVAQSICFISFLIALCIVRGGICQIFYKYFIIRKSMDHLLKFLSVMPNYGLKRCQRLLKWNGGCTKHLLHFLLIALGIVS